MFSIARIEIIWIKNSLILWFIKKYEVNLDESENNNINDYASFNEFFTRKLKINSRSISSSKLVSPVDGVVSQCGYIKNSEIIQAKGHYFDVSQLLGEKPTSNLENGQFMTIYLSPKNYHRVHMPFNGRLVAMQYIPGSLFSVNQKTANNVKGIFARNERLVCRFNTAFGEVFFVFVGAIFVGSIETSWQGQITPPYGKHSKVYHYTNNEFKLNKGDEMGRFNMGATVIMMLPEGTPELKLHSGQIIKMGQPFI